MSNNRRDMVDRLESLLSMAFQAVTAPSPAPDWQSTVMRSVTAIGGSGSRVIKEYIFSIKTMFRFALASIALAALIAVFSGNLRNGNNVELPYNSYEISLNSISGL